MLDSFVKCRCEMQFIKRQVGSHILGLVEDRAKVDHIIRFRFGIEDAYADHVKDRLTQHIQEEYSRRVNRRNR